MEWARGEGALQSAELRPIGGEGGVIPIAVANHARGTAEWSAVLGELMREHDVRGNLVPDAELAALAIEHRLTVCSADMDFARFARVDWHNPMAAGRR